MKKMMIAAAVAITAIASQAAAVKWVTSGDLTGIATASVGDNGNYAAGGSALKSNSSLAFSLYVYTSGTETLVDSLENVAIKYATGKKTVAYSWNSGELAQGTAYDYKLVVTGTQADLQALGVKGSYDYSAAMITGETSGSFTTQPSGTTTLTADIASWTVSGIVPVSTPPTPDVPEPTSGLLMLLGMAGLALRRKRA